VGALPLVNETDAAKGTTLLIYMVQHSPISITIIPQEEFTLVMIARK
jgi:hypothetical protein